MEEPSLPPHTATPQHPVGSSPNDLHFADDSHGHLTKPCLECWVTGHSNDSILQKHTLNMTMLLKHIMKINITTTMKTEE